MDRFIRRIAALGAGWALLGLASAIAQEPHLPPPPPTAADDARPPRRVLKDRPDGAAKQDGEFEDARRIFEKLPPEQREKFRENVRLWENLPPEQREELRVQE